MIKVTLAAKNPMDNGIVDCGCEIMLYGDIDTIALELGSLLSNISIKYPMVMDLALKYMQDNKNFMEAENDKTDINNN